MTERSPCGKRRATNGVWYVTTGLACFGNSLQDFQESALSVRFLTTVKRHVVPSPFSLLDFTKKTRLM